MQIFSAITAAATALKTALNTAQILSGFSLYPRCALLKPSLGGVAYIFIIEVISCRLILAHIFAARRFIITSSAVGVIFCYKPAFTLLCLL